MKVFLSWSGERSRAIAEVLRNWLPKVLQFIKPWMSAEDIGAGARWLAEVSTSLNDTKIGILIVTQENQHSPWLLFEAGALSKTLEQTCVCPVLFEMSAGQLSGPLTQFQANILTKEGITRVLTTINRMNGESAMDTIQLDEILDVWWPRLETALKQIPAIASPTSTRSTNDQLDELLQIARENLRRENLRIESGKDRDKQLDHVFKHMDGLTKGITMMQGQTKGLGASILRTLENLPDSMDPSHQVFAIDVDQTRAALDAMEKAVDVDSFKQMQELLRIRQDQQKVVNENMLKPPLVPPSESRG